MPIPPPNALKMAGRLRGFTLVEIMIVVAIIALLASIAVPAFQRARKRSQAVMVKADLRMIDDAMSQYAFENNKGNGTTLVFDSLKPYLKPNSFLYATGADLFGNPFGPTFDAAMVWGPVYGRMTYAGLRYRIE